MENNNNQEIDKIDSLSSSSIYDAAYLFLFPPISIFSLIANLLVFYILSERYFQKKPIYEYLKVSCLNCSIVNLIYAISFICDSRRYLDISNTEFATQFRCYFKIPVTNTCYFYGSVLDIVLAIDRLVEFRTWAKVRFRQLNPTCVCVSLLAVCIVVNAPYLFVFEPKKQIDYIFESMNSSLNSTEVNQKEVFYYDYGLSRFALTKEGRILMNVLYFVRDILTLVVLVSINLASLILLW